MRRWHRLAVLGCGAALTGYLVFAMGAAAVLASFRELSWRLVLLIVFPCFALKMFDTLGWRFAFPAERVGFWPLAASLLAGQAISSTTPTGMVGGNAVMAWTLRDRVSLRESFASLLIMQTTSTVSQGLFLLIGIVLARSTLSSSPLVRAMEWLLVLEAIGVTGFVVVQVVGIGSRGRALLARLGVAGSGALGEAATDVDQALSQFYRREPRRLALSLTCNLLGWITRAVETWLILFLLGATVSVSMALIIEAFTTGIGFATVFLPTDVGVEEGGAVATFLALGLQGPTGLSLSLVRRIREVAWVALGMVLLVGLKAPPAAALRTQDA
jgi:glycosyltransferase 2 family protein